MAAEDEVALTVFTNTVKSTLGDATTKLLHFPGAANTDTSTLLLVDLTEAASPRIVAYQHVVVEEGKMGCRVFEKRLTPEYIEQHVSDSLGTTLCVEGVDDPIKVAFDTYGLIFAASLGVFESASFSAVEDSKQLRLKIPKYSNYSSHETYHDLDLVHDAANDCVWRGMFAVYKSKYSTPVFDDSSSADMQSSVAQDGPAKKKVKTKAGTVAGGTAVFAATR